MEVARPTSALGDWFDPMSVLVEDAVSFEPPELVYDFIDRLLTSQQTAASGTCHQNLAHCPEENGDARARARLCVVTAPVPARLNARAVERTRAPSAGKPPWPCGRSPFPLRRRRLCAE